MKRRDFLLLSGVMAMAWNQASAKVETPRIGFVQESRQENHALLVAFRDGLSAFGWTDGSNVSVLTAGPRNAPRRCPPSSRN